MKVFLTLCCACLIFSPAWAKEMITYSQVVDDTWQIWVMEKDGNNKRQVTHTDHDKRGPTWLDGGREIAFRTSNSELFSVDLDGSNEQELFKKFGVVTNPAFSPSTQEIVFVRFDPRGKDMADIWKSDLKGENPRLLTKDKIGKFQPRFSVKGDKIVYVQRDRNLVDYHIWMMNADGSSPKQLTKGHGFDTHPDFSPDGNKIVFCSNQKNNNYEIYILDLKTRKVKALTNHPGLDTQPRFSPAGDQITFVSDRSGNQQIWVMDADGANAVALTQGPAEAIDPQWGEVEGKDKR